MPAADRGQSECLLRLTPFDIFRRKKAGKVVADDLVGSVTFDSFSTGFPTDNLAPRIHHEDRVVLDSVEEHLISCFAFPERFDQFTFGAVTLGRSGGSSRGNRTSNHE